MSALEDKLKPIVSENRKVYFEYYQAGSLWYSTEWDGMLFPVPVDDCGTALFTKEEKALYMMRWIRKHLANMAVLRQEPEYTYDGILKQKYRTYMAEPMTPTSKCHADSDGDCYWDNCPQLRDNEPKKSGRHCPIDTQREDEQ